MNKFPIIVILAGTSAICLGQSKAAVTSLAGYVSGVETTNNSGVWSGIVTSAQTATISYTHDLTTGSLSNTNAAPTEYKAINAAGQFGPKIFNGDNASLTSQTGSALVSTDGHSSMTSTAGAPVYYQATWTSTTETTGDGKAGTGTYDPWIVTYGDLAALGVPVGGTGSLYYQTGLMGGFSASSGFDLTPTGSGQYSFDASASQNGSTLDFFSITNNSATGLSATFNTYANFSVYLLNEADAHDPTATPGDRRNDAIEQVTSASQLLSIVTADSNADGSLNNDLDFGIFYDNVVLPPNYDPNGVVIAWHTDTFVNVQSTPEPASFAGLGLGLFGLLRRRSSKKNRS